MTSSQYDPRIGFDDAIGGDAREDTGINLKRVSALVDVMSRIAADIAGLKEQLATAEAAYARVEREDLPELMREVGLDSVKLRSGIEVTVVEEVTAGITEERRAAAHAWLREHNFGGLIKTVVAVQFGRGEEEEARALAERIRLQEHHDATLNETVHPQTLKAFVREQLEAGRPLPMDVFGVFPYSRAKIKFPKAKG